MKHLPKTRKQNLITRDLGDELLIYDELRHRAYCLNRTAAAVWKQCNGKRSIRQISVLLGNELTGDRSMPIDERLIWHAIKQFKRDQLLEEAIEIRQRQESGRPALVGGLQAQRFVAQPALEHQQPGRVQTQC